MSKPVKITTSFLPSQKKAIEAAIGGDLTGVLLRKTILSSLGIADKMPRAGLADASKKTRKRVSQARHKAKKAIREKNKSA